MGLKLTDKTMQKRGPKPISKPSYWSKTYYIQQKELGVSDLDLADHFHISIDTLYRWKRQLGFKSGDFKYLRLSGSKLRKPL